MSLGLPEFLDDWHTKLARLSALNTGHLVLISVTGWVDAIGNWTRDLSACSAVPQPTAPPSTPPPPLKLRLCVEPICQPTVPTLVTNLTLKSHYLKLWTSNFHSSICTLWRLPVISETKNDLQQRESNTLQLQMQVWPSFKHKYV
jgi:hypothetical protein